LVGRTGAASGVRSFLADPSVGAAGTAGKGTVMGRVWLWGSGRRINRFGGFEIKSENDAKR